MSNIIDLLRPSSAMSYDNGVSGLTATTVKAALDEIEGRVDTNETDIADLTTLSGVSANATNLGTFTGATIADSRTVKQALQDLETAYEETDQNVDDLITLSGVAENATNLGTFTGSTIADSVTVKVALQSLETAYEETDQNVDDLVTLSGVAENATNLGTFTGTTIADSRDVKQALQDLETAHETLSNINLEWQDSALDFVTDNTAVPATEVSGDRYILSDAGGAPHANWDGASAGDIVEFNGTTWDAVTPTTGMFISADDEDTLLYYWGGAAWEQKLFESTTASTGLTKSGVDIQLADAAENASGIKVLSGAITLEDLGAFDTDDLSEGSSNLYFTEARVRATVLTGFVSGAGTVAAGDSVLTAINKLDGNNISTQTDLDAVEDNGIASTDGSLSTSGTIGADNLVVETVFSTSGVANRSIDANDLASVSNGLGASMVGIEDSGANFTATDVEAALAENADRIDVLESGGTNDWVVKTAAFTMSDGDKILADTDTTAAFTLTLPATPSVGDEVVVRDSVRNAGTDAITIGRNGSNIAGLAEDLVINIDGIQVHLVYSEATHGWSVIAA